MTSITIRLSEETKENLIQIAEKQGLTLSDYLRQIIENADSASVLRQHETDDDTIVLRLTSSLKGKLQETAEVLDTSIEDLAKQGLEICGYIHPKAWGKLSFNRERTSRHFSESQQIVDIVNQHFNVPPVKWGRVCKG